MALTLIYRGNISVVGALRPALTIGREDGNDIVVLSLFASRSHARVEWRDGRYLLIDASTNGTFLWIDGEAAERRLRREEAELTGRGWFGLGKSAETHGDHSVRFTLHQDGP